MGAMVVVSDVVDLMPIERASTLVVVIPAVLHVSAVQTYPYRIPTLTVRLGIRCLSNEMVGIGT